MSKRYRENSKFKQNGSSKLYLGNTVGLIQHKFQNSIFNLNGRLKTKFQKVMLCQIAFGHCYIKHPSDWDSYTLKDIVSDGKNIFKNCKIEKLPNMFNNLGGFEMEMSVTNPIMEGVLCSKSDNLYEGLKKYFQKNQNGIFESKNIVIWIWKHRKSGNYFLFDCNGRTRDCYLNKLCNTVSLIFMENLLNVLYIIVEMSQLNKTDKYSIRSIQMKNCTKIKVPLKMEEQYMIIDSHLAIVRASIHIENECFGNQTNEHKSLATCSQALMYDTIHPPNSWNTQIMDNLLKLGYRISVEHNNKLPEIFNLNPFIIQFAIKRKIHFGILQNISENIFKYFETNTRGLVEIKSRNQSIVLAVWKRSGLFYLFDPYSRNQFGRAIDDRDMGSACLHMQSKLGRIPEIIVENALRTFSKHNEKSITHEIHAVNIKIKNTRNLKALNYSIDEEFWPQIDCKPTWHFESPTPSTCRFIQKCIESDVVDMTVNRINGESNPYEFKCDNQDTIINNLIENLSEDAENKIEMDNLNALINSNDEKENLNLIESDTKNKINIIEKSLEITTDILSSGRREILNNSHSEVDITQNTIKINNEISSNIQELSKSSENENRKNCPSDIQINLNEILQERKEKEQISVNTEKILVANEVFKTIDENVKENLQVAFHQMIEENIFEKISVVVEEKRKRENLVILDDNKKRERSNSNLEEKSELIVIHKIDVGEIHSTNLKSNADNLIGKENHNILSSILKNNNGEKDSSNESKSQSIYISGHNEKINTFPSNEQRTLTYLKRSEHKLINKSKEDVTKSAAMLPDRSSDFVQNDQIVQSIKSNKNAGFIAVHPLNKSSMLLPPPSEQTIDQILPSSKSNKNVGFIAVRPHNPNKSSLTKLLSTSFGIKSKILILTDTKAFIIFKNNFRFHLYDNSKHAYDSNAIRQLEFDNFQSISMAFDNLNDVIDKLLEIMFD